MAWNFNCPDFELICVARYIHSSRLKARWAAFRFNHYMNQSICHQPHESQEVIFTLIFDNIEYQLFKID